MTCNQSLVLENISEAVASGQCLASFPVIFSSCSEAKKGQVQQLLNEYKVMHNKELRDIWVWLSENYRPAILGCLNTKWWYMKINFPRLLIFHFWVIPAILSLSSRQFLRRQPSVACDATWWPVQSSKQHLWSFFRCKVAAGHQVFPLNGVASGVALPTCPLAFAEARLFLLLTGAPVQYCLVIKLDNGKTSHLDEKIIHYLHTEEFPSWQVWLRPISHIPWCKASIFRILSLSYTEGPSPFSDILHVHMYTYTMATNICILTS